MKFKIKKEVIERKINDAFWTINSNNTISIPIYKAVLFEVCNDQIIMIASNTAVSIKTTIVINDKILKIESTGKFLVPIRKIQDLIKKTDSNVLLFEKKEENILTISTKNSKYSLQLYKPIDYPKLDFETKGKKINIDKKTIEEVNHNVVFAADNEHKQTRKEFSGINFFSDEKKAYFIATNMHRLSKLDFNIEEKNLDIIIPTMFFRLLGKINSFKNSEIEIWISKEKTQIKNERSTIQFQNIVGKYPDTSKVIPTNFSTSVIVNKIELEKALDRIEVFTNQENKINILIDNEKFLINSKNQHTGLSFEKLEKFNKQGEDVNISMSSKYISDVIKTISSNEVKISFNSNQKPILIEDSNNKKTTHIILPYRSEV